MPLDISSILPAILCPEAPETKRSPDKQITRDILIKQKSFERNLIAMFSLKTKGNAVIGKKIFIDSFACLFILHLLLSFSMFIQPL
jgi:hypothetical protein